MAIVLIRAVRTKKKANYGSPTVPEGTFSAWMFCVVFFLEIHDVLKFSDIHVLKGKSLLLFHKS